MVLPLVAVPARASDPEVDPPPDSFLVNQAYVAALTSAGAVPFIVPHLLAEPALRQLYDFADGILLAGGDDIDPAHYGAPAHRALGRTESGRDTVELTLARWAIEDGKPLFGVCRGMQLMNVVAGGTLIQDIASRTKTALAHDAGEDCPRDLRVHLVRIEPTSQLANVVGREPIHVNSRHHQALEVLAPHFRAVAWATDGIVEAIEAATAESFALGVQWHPESLAPDESTTRLFEAFVAASAAYGRRLETGAALV